MSLFHLINSGASASPNVNPTSTPVTARSVTQSAGSILRRRRDSNDFEYDFDEIVTRPAGTAITPKTKKRLKMSCDEVARLYDVKADDLKRFSEVREIFLELCH